MGMGVSSPPLWAHSCFPLRGSLYLTWRAYLSFAHSGLGHHRVPLLSQLGHLHPPHVDAELLQSRQAGPVYMTAGAGSLCSTAPLHNALPLSFSPFVPPRPPCWPPVLGLDLTHSGVLSVLPWITMAVSANVGGWIADTLVEKGASVTTVRKVRGRL